MRRPLSPDDLVVVMRDWVEVSVVRPSSGVELGFRDVLSLVEGYYPGGVRGFCGDARRVHGYEGVER